MTIAIETRHLSKTFKSTAGWRRTQPGLRTAAVSDVNLTVPAGELFGLLGVNGAGKTTLVKILCTLILPDGGAATVAGYDLSEAADIRQVVGLVVSDERSFYWRLSVRQNLAFFAAMYDLRGAQAESRIGQVLESVDLLPIADKLVSVLSAGMRQRLAIARGLLHRPSLLFLDEPSRSLDPVATARLHELIRSLNEDQGVTIFLITHDLAEAEKLCQRVALMHQGRIQVIGQPEDLRRRLKPQTEYRLLVDKLNASAEWALGQLLPSFRSENDGGHSQLSFSVADGSDQLNDVLDNLREQKIQILSIESRPPTLEEVFAHYAGQKGEGS
jgi:ABC-2 type transport system ATP-binding protein